jgi:hypothetical protein
MMLNPDIEADIRVADATTRTDMVGGLKHVIPLLCGR